MLDRLKEKIKLGTKVLVTLGVGLFNERKERFKRHEWLKESAGKVRDCFIEISLCPIVDATS